MNSCKDIWYSLKEKEESHNVVQINRIILDTFNTLLQYFPSIHNNAIMTIHIIGVIIVFLLHCLGNVKTINITCGLIEHLIDDNSKKKRETSHDNNTIRKKGKGPISWNTGMKAKNCNIIIFIPRILRMRRKENKLQKKEQNKRYGKSLKKENTKRRVISNPKQMK